METGDCSGQLPVAAFSYPVFLLALRLHRPSQSLRPPSPPAPPGLLPIHRHLIWGVSLGSIMTGAGEQARGKAKSDKRQVTGRKTAVSCQFPVVDSPSVVCLSSSAFLPVDFLNCPGRRCVHSETRDLGRRHRGGRRPGHVGRRKSWRRSAYSTGALPAIP